MSNPNCMEMAMLAAADSYSVTPYDLPDCAQEEEAEVEAEENTFEFA